MTNSMKTTDGQRESGKETEKIQILNLAGTEWKWRRGAGGKDKKVKGPLSSLLPKPLHKSVWKKIQRYSFF